MLVIQIPAHQLLVYKNVFFFQAEDGIRYLVRSRGLGDVYKRQSLMRHLAPRHLLPLDLPGCAVDRDEREFVHLGGSLSLIHI